MFSASVFFRFPRHLAFGVGIEFAPESAHDDCLALFQPFLCLFVLTIRDMGPHIIACPVQFLGPLFEIDAVIVATANRMDEFVG